jgi:hypothetical protein
MKAALSIVRRVITHFDKSSVFRRIFSEERIKQNDPDLILIQVYELIL